ncbi:MAG: acyl-CoA dehydrogenase family protein [candidate division Zixibacteria bacterium]|nr:acyl-CoA dehydrogenase family protein [candidate division Zixibacteria bacterium]MDH3936678.1 acyl-CoA dehydrogenase family protein [candidate division Zixibacteria bacterium]MDH4034501.1 acyl-CoA dehydrogenase family protein [candidate division Zixibacteria bacterium]
MNKNVDERQQAVRDEVKAFAEKEMYPVSRQLDEMPEPRTFPHELYKKLGDAGFIGYVMPKEYEGQGKSSLEYITLVEELCYHDAAIGLLAAVAELATHPIIYYASDEHKKKYVPDCAMGRRIPSFVLTEPNAGSDAASLTTVAVETDDGYVINGEKTFIMHGDVCDLGVLFCKIEGKPKLSAFIVDCDQPGWQGRTLANKMGMRAATTGGIILKDVKVPKENLLGEIGRGFRYAMGTLDSARVGVAAQGVGIAQRALDESVSYAKKRVAFGAPIAKLQAIQWMIADMAVRLEAARALTYKAAQMQDRGEKFSVEAAMAKLYASEASNFCVDRAMQIHSGYGYIGEFTQIEKIYRDQRVLEIYEGTSEVQRLVIAGTIIGR